MFTDNLPLNEVPAPQGSGIILHIPHFVPPSASPATTSQKHSAPTEETSGMVSVDKKV